MHVLALIEIRRNSFKLEGIFTAFHFLLILSIKSFILSNSEVILPISYFSCKQNVTNITKYYITNKKTYMEYQLHKIDDCLMVFNATFNNISAISWRSVLLVEETGVPWENHRPVASHWQTLSHNVVSSKPRLSGVRTHNLKYINFSNCLWLSTLLIFWNCFDSVVFFDFLLIIFPVF